MRGPLPINLLLLPWAKHVVSFLELTQHIYTGQETRQKVVAALAKKAELDEEKVRDRLERPAVKAAAEDSRKSEELEMQWHQEEAARAAKARQHIDTSTSTNTNTH
jgi:hypothetical protein